MKETDWFSCMTTPVRPGVYRVQHRGSDRVVYSGYSLFQDGMWRPTATTAEQAARFKFPSVQQSREWKGLMHDDVQS